MIRIPYISLVNIIAGKQVVKEYIQHQATPENISAEIVSLLRDRKRYQKMQDGLREIKKELGQAGAAQRAAQLVCDLLKPSTVMDPKIQNDTLKVLPDDRGQ